MIVGGQMIASFRFVVWFWARATFLDRPESRHLTYGPTTGNNMSDNPCNFDVKITETLAFLPWHIISQLDFGKSKRLRIDGEINGVRIECGLMPSCFGVREPGHASGANHCCRESSQGACLRTRSRPTSVQSLVPNAQVPRSPRMTSRTSQGNGKPLSNDSQWQCKTWD
ncbi:hypothetical protein Poly59_57520 [Rubripirellula reticaptiva]|uniref:Uncharacterized protein n=1 Tax=Rubripirellula reticaptiva TaxID=2528013 RepID=A0A5C6EHT4_9BACT|nr:hypothetical protein Poly59_57520 [Rubripirellula reticaptiva]